MPRFQSGKAPGAPISRVRTPFGPGGAAPLDLAGRLDALVAEDAAPEAVYGLPDRRAPVRLPAARGYAKHCPVCRQSFGHFLAFGLRRRRNARCPGCGSLERHRFLWLYLERVLRLPGSRLSLLHIAPEACIRARLDGLPRLRYRAIDLYRPEAATAMDATRLAFPDASFDLLICSHVLEHIVADRKALSEMARVLRPGGRAVILVPLDLRRTVTYEERAAVTAGQRLAAFGHPYHVRICGADYGERIAEAGFAVTRVDSAALSSHRRRYWRLNKASLFDCRRL
jgi:SAM-dependent methyltransferase